MRYEAAEIKPEGPSLIARAGSAGSANNRVRTTSLGAAATAIVAAGLLLLSSCQKTPKTTSDVLNLMRRYEHQKRYDDAIGVATEWEARYPGNASGNGFLDQQIAMLYLQKAQSNTMNQDELIQQAAVYSNKGLALQSRPDMTNLTLAAEVFELAGDLSASARCEYYRKSVTLFEELIPMEQDVEQRASKDRDESTMSRVRAKIVQAGCRQEAGSPR